MKTPKAIIGLFLVLVTRGVFACSITSPPPDYDFVLLPIATTGWRGAFGSHWVTELSLFNASGRTLHLQSYNEPDLYPLKYRCLVPGECDEFPTVRDNTTFDLIAHLFQPDDAPFPGMYLYVTRSISDDLHYALRVRDVTRQAESAGTEIPVVRSTELRTEVTQLLNVPTDPRFRLTLRIYDTSSTHPHLRVPPEYRVRIYPMNTQAADPNREVRIRPETTVRYTGGLDNWAKPCAYLPVYPSYAELAGSVFQDLHGVGPIRIEIEPLGFTGGYWAFISVTNNETQHVTTVTPH